jgi:hypothetical protein
MSEYTKQAEKFMQETATTMNVTFLRYAPYFDNEKDSRDIYHIKLQRNNKDMEFDFGQSIANSLPPLKPFEKPVGRRKRIPPTAYDILACLTKYEPEKDVWEFANEFGYEIKNREDFNRVDRTHMAVIKEYRNVMRLFGDVIDRLREIT